jgi:peptide/nickel transport system substrate-binding protein/oligopeptide transport system substrate-binding protein
LDNIKVRQALELALNKDVLSTAIYSGGRTPTCHIVPEGQPGYNSKLTCPGGAPTKGDTAKAKELFTAGLAEEGLTLATFPKLKFTYASGSTTLANLITTILQTWKQVLGVDIGTEVVDFNTLLTKTTAAVCTKADYTQCLNQGLAIWDLAWGADYPDPQDWLTLQFDKGAANNSWNYGQNGSSDAATQVATQQLMEKADTDLGSDRISLYNQAEQQLVNDVAWLPLDQRTGHYLQKSYVVGTVDNSITEIPPDDWGNVYVAVH